MSKIDQKIIALQRSTTTLWARFIPVHNLLRMRSKLYYRWHITPWSRPLHWLILFVYLATIIGGIGFGLRPTQETTLASGYDYPRWTTLSPAPVSSGVNTIKVLDADTLWLGEANGIVRTWQQGQWKQQKGPSANALVALDAYSSARAYAMDLYGGIYNFDGINWRTDLPFLFDAGLYGDYNDLAALDQNNIWAVGEKTVFGSGGRVAKYNGSAWSEQSLATDKALLALGAVSSSVLWVGGEDGVLFKTTNGGASWVAQTSTLSSDINAIHALSSTTAWAVGDGGKIIKTTDGSTWVEQTSTIANNLNAIHALSSTTAWAVGDGGKIVKTTDGITWAEQTSSVSVALRSVGATSAQNLFAGGDNAVLLASANGGSSWQRQTGGIDLLGDLSFADKLALSGPDNVVVAHSDLISGDMQIARHNGQSWSVIKDEDGTYSQVGHLSTSGPSHIWATIGQQIIFYNGTSWQDQYNPGENIGALQALSTSSALAIGVSGAIYGYNGAEWSVVKSAPAQIGTAFEIRSADLIYSFAGDGTAIYKYNGTDWSTLFSGSGHGSVAPKSNFSAASDSSIWFADLNKKIYQFNGSAWSVAHEPSASGRSIYAFAEDNIVVAGGDDSIPSMIRFNGTSWENTITGATATLGIFSQSGSDNMAALGTTLGQSINVVNFFSPPNATATKYLIKLPGQEFVDGIGIVGVAQEQTVGTAFSASVYAVDQNNLLDRGNASFANIGTTDPNDQSAAQIQLTQGGTCVQVDRQEGDPECGIGTVNVTFHTSGSWQIFASDPNNVLASAQSAVVKAKAGPPAAIKFTTASQSTVAGRPIGPITLALFDQYNNPTTASTNITVSWRSGEAGRGYFAPWQGSEFSATLSQVISAGSSSTSVSYLDYRSGQNTIIAEVAGSGWSQIQQTVTISEGAVSPTLSTVAIASSTSVSDTPNLSFTISLKDANDNPVAGRQMRVLSSRGSDDQIALAGLTNTAGQVTGTIHARKAGNSRLQFYNQTDDIYLDIRHNLVFEPLAPSQLQLRLEQETIVAGEALKLRISWSDRFGNSAKLGRGKIAITTSDSRAELAQDTQSSFLLSRAQASEKRLELDYGATDSSGKQIELKYYTVGSHSVGVQDVDNRLSALAAFGVVAAAPDYQKSRFSLNSNSVTLGSSIGSRVELVDRYDNPISDKLIKLSALDQDGFVSITPTAAITDTSGVARFRIGGAKLGQTTLVAVNQSDSRQLSQTQQIKVVSATAVQKLLETLRDNEVIRNINEKVLRPIAEGFAGASLLVQAMAAIPQGLHYLAYLLGALMQVKRYRKAKQPWGMAYDSLTGKPVTLATVRLFEYPSRRLIATEVTDIEGKFEFVAPPGQYHITANRNDYQFPSTFFAPSAIAEGILPKSDRYLGQPFVINDENKPISLNVPLDPLKPNWTLALRSRLIMLKVAGLADFLISVLALPLLIIGSLLSLFALILEPTSPRAIALVLIYLLLTLFAALRRFMRVNRQAVVYDSDTGKPLSHVVIAMIDTEYNMTRSTILTDQSGRFSILLRPGRYELKFDYPTYRFDDQPKRRNKLAPLSRSRQINIKQAQYLHASFALRKEAQPPEVNLDQVPPENQVG